MTVTDELLANNSRYARSFTDGDRPVTPAKHLAVVACMDSRLDVHALLGLALGEVHVIRNAGGIVSEDVIRSLAVSQRLLGTREIVLIHHTDCGMLTFRDDELSDAIQREIGRRPPFAFGAFPDLDENVRESIARIRESPFIPHRGAVRGFVFDVRTGRLREVKAD